MVLGDERTQPRGESLRSIPGDGLDLSTGGECHQSDVSSLLRAVREEHIDEGK